MPVARNGSAWLAWRSVGPERGPRAAEPLLLIMGLSGSSRLWWRLIPHLEPHRRMILFDNRGTGDSDRISGRMTMADMAADAVAVLDAAGVERAHVFGVSMGGMVAQHLALDHRDRVASLILGCTTGGGRRGAPPWRLLASAALRPALGPERTLPLISPALYSNRTREQHPDRVADDLERRVADDTPNLTTYAQMAAIAAHDTRERLHELGGLPVLVLHGDEDGLVPVDQGQRLARLIPGARLVLFDNCGHILPTDAEEGTARAVLEHLERCDGRSSQAA